MRLKHAILTVTALAVLSTLTACGNNGDDGAGGGTGIGGDSFSALPSVKSHEDLVAFVDKTVGCNDREDFDPRRHQGSMSRAIRGDGLTNASVCFDDATNGVYHVFTADDMAVFQRSFQQRIEPEGADSVMVGENFVVNIRFIDQAEPFAKAGLLYLNCVPNLQVPEGYTSRPAFDRGCVLTDYALR